MREAASSYHSAQRWLMPASLTPRGDRSAFSSTAERNTLRPYGHGKASQRVATQQAQELAPRQRRANSLSPQPVSRIPKPEKARGSAENARSALHGFSPCSHLFTAALSAASSRPRSLSLLKKCGESRRPPLRTAAATRCCRNPAESSCRSAPAKCAAMMGES